MMALDARKCTLHIKQWPDVMNKSNRVHARIQEFLSGRGGGGGGGGGCRGPTAKKQSGQCIFSHQLILQFTECQWFYYRGEEGSYFFQGVGVSRETHITCDFPWGGGGGPDPLTPSGSARGVA